MSENQRQLIQCQESLVRGPQVLRCAYLHSHPDKPENPPIFRGKTDGEAAGKVLAWMVDSTDLRCDRVEVAIH